MVIPNIILLLIAVSPCLVIRKGYSFGGPFQVYRSLFCAVVVVDHFVGIQRPCQLLWTKPLFNFDSDAGAFHSGKRPGMRLRASISLRMLSIGLPFEGSCVLERLSDHT